jgi:hypothetical protein
MMLVRCAICSRRLSGRQRKYCSRACKNKDTNHQFQSYEAQQARGVARKLALIRASGGGCARCGYKRNLAAMGWHHREPTQKAFEMDLRNLSNRSEATIALELAKCVLLCANCHAEEHFPQHALPRRVVRGRVHARKL